MGGVGGGKGEQKTIQKPRMKKNQRITISKIQNKITTF